MGPLRRAAAVNEFVCQRLRILPTRQDRAELATLTALIEDAKLTPVLDRIYPLAETDESLRHVETGHARGKVVITVALKPRLARQ
jgi:NADPH:quinone reductase-like Zn-dependent oxidoreductase